jgi:hypothetical protein
VVVCPIVIAELSPHFTQREELSRFLGEIGIEPDGFTLDALWSAGEAWSGYRRRRGVQVQCPRCGEQAALRCPACQAPLIWRQHLIADFLIGGHALTQADALLTRDPGYYRTDFPQLPLIIPGASTAPPS